MVSTFDALAKFGDENANNDTQPEKDNMASVDLSAVISRLNDLENAINEIRREKATEPQTADNSTRLENDSNATNEQNTNEQGVNNNGN